MTLLCLGEANHRGNRLPLNVKPNLTNTNPSSTVGAMNSKKWEFVFLVRQVKVEKLQDSKLFSN